MNYKIRWAQPDDAQTLGQLHTRSWQKAYKNIVPNNILSQLDSDKRTEKFKKAIKENKKETAVIILNEQVVGFITLGKNRDQDYDDQTGEIWGIYLHPDYWHQGLGSKLIKWGIKDLKERGYKRITLWVFKDNKSSREFYKKNGFKYDGTEGEIKKGKSIKKVRYLYDLKH